MLPRAVGDKSRDDATKNPSSARSHRTSNLQSKWSTAGTLQCSLLNDRINVENVGQVVGFALPEVKSLVQSIEKQQSSLQASRQAVRRLTFSASNSNVDGQTFTGNGSVLSELSDMGKVNSPISVTMERPAISTRVAECNGSNSVNKLTDIVSPKPKVVKRLSFRTFVYEHSHHVQYIMSPLRTTCTTPNRNKPKPRDPVQEQTGPHTLGKSSISNRNLVEMLRKIGFDVQHSQSETAAVSDRQQNRGGLIDNTRILSSSVAGVSDGKFKANDNCAWRSDGDIEEPSAQQTVSENICHTSRPSNETVARSDSQETSPPTDPDPAAAVTPVDCGVQVASTTHSVLDSEIPESGGLDIDGSSSLAVAAGDGNRDGEVFRYANAAQLTENSIAPVPFEKSGIQSSESSSSTFEARAAPAASSQRTASSTFDSTSIPSLQNHCDSNVLTLLLKTVRSQFNFKLPAAFAEIPGSSLTRTCSVDKAKVGDDDGSEVSASDGGPATATTSLDGDDESTMSRTLDSDSSSKAVKRKTPADEDDLEEGELVTEEETDELSSRLPRVDDVQSPYQSNKSVRENIQVLNNNSKRLKTCSESDVSSSPSSQKRTSAQLSLKVDRRRISRWDRSGTSPTVKSPPLQQSSPRRLGVNILRRPVENPIDAAVPLRNLQPEVRDTHAAARESEEYSRQLPQRFPSVSGFLLNYRAPLGSRTAAVLPSTTSVLLRRDHSLPDAAAVSQHCPELTTRPIERLLPNWESGRPAIYVPSLPHQSSILPPAGRSDGPRRAAARGRSQSPSEWMKETERFLTDVCQNRNRRRSSTEAAVDRRSSSRDEKFSKRRRSSDTRSRSSSPDCYITTADLPVMSRTESSDDWREAEQFYNDSKEDDVVDEISCDVDDCTDIYESFHQFCRHLWRDHDRAMQRWLNVGGQCPSRQFERCQIGGRNRRDGDSGRSGKTENKRSCDRQQSEKPQPRQKSDRPPDALSESESIEARLDSEIVAGGNNSRRSTNKRRDEIVIELLASDVEKQEHVSIVVSSSEQSSDDINSSKVHRTESLALSAAVHSSHSGERCEDDAAETTSRQNKSELAIGGKVEKRSEEEEEKEKTLKTLSNRSSSYSSCSSESSTGHAGGRPLSRPKSTSVKSNENLGDKSEASKEKDPKEKNARDDTLPLPMGQDDKRPSIHSKNISLKSSEKVKEKTESSKDSSKKTSHGHTNSVFSSESSTEQADKRPSIHQKNTSLKSSEKVKEKTESSHGHTNSVSSSKSSREPAGKHPSNRPKSSSVKSNENVRDKSEASKENDPKEKNVRGHTHPLSSSASPKGHDGKLPSSHPKFTYLKSIEKAKDKTEASKDISKKTTSHSHTNSVSSSESSTEQAGKHRSSCPISTSVKSSEKVKEKSEASNAKDPKEKNGHAGTHSLSHSKRTFVKSSEHVRGKLEEAKGKIPKEKTSQGQSRSSGSSQLLSAHGKSSQVREKSVNAKEGGNKKRVLPAAAECSDSVKKKVAKLESVARKSGCNVTCERGHGQKNENSSDQRSGLVPAQTASPELVEVIGSVPSSEAPMCSKGDSDMASTSAGQPAGEASVKRRRRKRPNKRKRMRRNLAVQAELRRLGEGPSVGMAPEQDVTVVTHCAPVAGIPPLKDAAGSTVQNSKLSNAEQEDASKTNVVTPDVVSNVQDDESSGKDAGHGSMSVSVAMSSGSEKCELPVKPVLYNSVGGIAENTDDLASCASSSVSVAEDSDSVKKTVAGLHIASRSNVKCEYRFGQKKQNSSDRRSGSVVAPADSGAIRDTISKSPFDSKDVAVGTVQRSNTRSQAEQEANKTVATLDRRSSVQTELDESRGKDAINISPSVSVTMSSGSEKCELPVKPVLCHTVGGIAKNSEKCELPVKPVLCHTVGGIAKNSEEPACCASRPGRTDAGADTNATSVSCVKGQPSTDRHEREITSLSGATCATSVTSIPSFESRQQTGGNDGRVISSSNSTAGKPQQTCGNSSLDDERRATRTDESNRFVKPAITSATVAGVKKTASPKGKRIGDSAIKSTANGSVNCRYVCDVLDCNTYFTLWSTYQAHIMNNHRSVENQVTYYVCDEAVSETDAASKCSAVILSPSQLNSHMKQAHGKASGVSYHILRTTLTQMQKANENVPDCVTVGAAQAVTAVSAAAAADWAEKRTQTSATPSLGTVSCLESVSLTKTHGMAVVNRRVTGSSSVEAVPTAAAAAEGNEGKLTPPSETRSTDVEENTGKQTQLPPETLSAAVVCARQQTSEVRKQQSDGRDECVISNSSAARSQQKVVCDMSVFSNEQPAGGNGGTTILSATSSSSNTSVTKTENASRVGGVCGRPVLPGAESTVNDSRIYRYVCDVWNCNTHFMKWEMYKEHTSTSHRSGRSVKEQVSCYVCDEFVSVAGKPRSRCSMMFLSPSELSTHTKQMHGKANGVLYHFLTTTWSQLEKTGWTSNACATDRVAILAAPKVVVDATAEGSGGKRTQMSATPPGTKSCAEKPTLTKIGASSVSNQKSIASSSSTAAIPTAAGAAAAAAVAEEESAGKRTPSSATSLDASRCSADKLSTDSAFDERKQNQHLQKTGGDGSAAKRRQTYDMFSVMDEEDNFSRTIPSAKAACLVDVRKTEKDLQLGDVSARTCSTGSESTGKVSSPGRRYVCKVLNCESTFTSLYAYQKHVNGEHSAVKNQVTYYICDELASVADTNSKCSAVILSTSVLRDHMLRLHNKASGFAYHYLRTTLKQRLASSEVNRIFAGNSPVKAKPTVAAAAATGEKSERAVQQTQTPEAPLTAEKPTSNEGNQIEEANVPDVEPNVADVIPEATAVDESKRESSHVEPYPAVANHGYLCNISACAEQFKSWLCTYRHITAVHTDVKRHVMSYVCDEIVAFEAAPNKPSYRRRCAAVFGRALDLHKHMSRQHDKTMDTGTYHYRVTNSDANVW